MIRENLGMLYGLCEAEKVGNLCKKLGLVLVYGWEVIRVQNGVKTVKF